MLCVRFGRDGESDRPASGQSPRLPSFPATRTTRYLCYAVHLDENLREYVLHSVIDSHLQALCPSFGVDLVRVARHTMLAQRRGNFRRAAFVVIRLSLLLAVAAGVLSGSAPLAAAIFAVAVLAGWCVLLWNLRANGMSALKVVTDFGKPEDQADPLEPALEERLRKVGKANVVVYADGEFDPFIGSGRRLHFYQINPVDVNAGGRRPWRGQAADRPVRRGSGCTSISHRDPGARVRRTACSEPAIRARRLCRACPRPAAG